MSKERASAVVDYGKLSKVEGSPFNDMIAIATCSHCPPLAKLLDLKKGEEIPDELIEEMRDYVHQIYASGNHEIEGLKKKHKDISKKEPKIVALMGDGQFCLEKVLATALVAIDEGKNSEEVKQAAISAYNKLEDVLRESNERDFRRDRIILDVNGKIYAVKSAEELRGLFPELSPEQAGYITALGSQSLIACAGSMPISMCGLTTWEEVKDRTKGESVSRYVDISDGQVRIVSSKEFGVLRMLDPEAIEAYTIDNDSLPTLRSSLVVDISQLRGKDYRLGCSRGVQVTQVVTSLDPTNDSLVQGLASQADRMGGLDTSPDSKEELNKTISGALRRGASTQASIAKGDKRTPSETAMLEQPMQKRIEAILNDESKAIFEKVQALELASPEFAAETLAMEYAAQTPMWEFWKMSKEANIGEVSGVDVKQQLSPSAILQTKIAIYATLEQDSSKRANYAAAQLVQYPNAKNLKPEQIEEMFQPLLPAGIEKLPNAKKIAADLKDSMFSRTKMSPEERVRKISDKILLVTDPEKVVIKAIASQKRPPSPTVPTSPRKKVLGQKLDR